MSNIPVNNSSWNNIAISIGSNLVDREKTSMMAFGADSHSNDRLLIGQNIYQQT